MSALITIQMGNDMLKLCEQLIETINTSEQAVWYFRRQYFFKGHNALRRLIVLLQEETEMLAVVFGEQVTDNMGIAELLDAQEREDETLIADVLEGVLIPSLMQLVQSIQSEMSVEDIDYSEKNELLLKKVFSEKDIKKIRTAAGYENCEYIPEFTASGQMTVCLQEKQYTYYLCGNNNPYRDAVRFADGNLEDEIYRYVLLGAGMLYEAEAIIEKRPDAELLIVEEDPYLLRLAIRYRDLSELFSNSGVKIALGNYSDYIAQVDAKQQRILIKKPTLRHMTDENSKDMVERFFMKMMTIKEQAYILEKNFRENITSQKNVHGIDEIREQFYGKKIWFVAGGPSLDKTLSFLKKKDKRELILSVGTVAARLLREGIQPDYIIITDSADTIYRQLMECPFSENTSLLYLCTANAKAVASYKGKKYAIFQRGFDMAEEYAKKKNHTLMSTGGSVSTTALDICIQFGCREMICMGLDLAYTGNVSHAEGTLGNRKVLTGSQTRYVKAVTGENIPTSLNLYTYHHWIENRIKDVKGIKLKNVSDGAFINGMENITTSSYEIINKL